MAGVRERGEVGQGEAGQSGPVEWHRGWTVLEGTRELLRVLGCSCLVTCGCCVEGLGVGNVWRCGDGGSGWSTFGEGWMSGR